MAAFEESTLSFSALTSEVAHKYEKKFYSSCVCKLYMQRGARVVFPFSSGPILKLMKFTENSEQISPNLGSGDNCVTSLLATIDHLS